MSPLKSACPPPARKYFSGKAAIHNIQRSIIEAWVRQVDAGRPDISRRDARFAVHAAFSLVVDLGRLMQYERKPRRRPYGT